MSNKCNFLISMCYEFCDWIWTPRQEGKLITKLIRQNIQKD